MPRRCRHTEFQFVGERGLHVEALSTLLRNRQAPAGQCARRDDLVQFAAITERHVRSITELSASPSLALKLGVEAGTRLLRVEMLRVDPSKPDAPLCWTDVYLEVALGTGIKRELRNSTGLICEMVEKRFGRSVQNVRQEIRAIGVPANIAEPLGVAPDSHALEIVRRYFDARGLVFEATVSVFPADRYSYALELTRQG
ncbi:UTRA domain-containing protein [Paraburkholderia diazotrophica]|uniref:GntR family transcriptional regulator n=1 Tax=Paraburkholderia diazotrophica TaxID=667676 RepID=UPI00317BC36F